MEIPLTAELKAILEADGYYKHVCFLPGAKICAIAPLAFTHGLFIGIDEMGNYKGRYCYHTAPEARAALLSRNGEADPPGEWIKFKGYGGDRSRLPDPYERQFK